MSEDLDQFNKYYASIDEALEKFYQQARRHFGDAVTSYWFYDGDLCPACGRQPIGPIRVKNRDALSLNAFIYRERGVLIGYFLCKACAGRIFRDAQARPYQQTEVHAAIEANLVAAYRAHVRQVNN